MADVLELPRLVRSMQATELTVKRTDDGPRTLVLSASSDTPLARWWGTEVLSHEAGAVRLERIQTGAAPLLFNHDWNDPVGMVSTGTLADGRLQIEAALFDTERAREVAAMVDGGLRNISIGYEIHTLTEAPAGQFTATDWEPFEVSIVTVPADPAVGIGRDADRQPKPVRVVRAGSSSAQPAARPPEVTMTQETAQAAAAVDIKDMEQRRVAAINKLSRANKVPAAAEKHWIESGASLEQVSDELLVLLEERGKQASNPALLDMGKKDLGRYSVLRAMRAMLSKDWSKAGLELEAHQAVMARAGVQPRSETSLFVPFDVQVRDMTSAGVSGSENLVGTDHLGGSFVELLRNESVVMRLGATKLSGLQGNVAIPKQSAAATAYWLANENTAITESQPTLSQVTLSPKNVAALTEISHQLMQQSDPSAEQLVMTDLARVLAQSADLAALAGTGTGGEPTGIINTTGIGTFGTVNAMEYADILEAQTDLASFNALRPGCAYVADPTTAGLLMGRSRFANTDTPLWDGSLLDANMGGFPALATNQMSANTMLFGWWPSVIIGEWGVLELQTNPYSDFTRGLSAIRAWYTMDVALRYPQAFTYDAATS